MPFFLRRHAPTLAGVIAGTIASYAWFEFSGCDSGGCILSRYPIQMMIVGGLMGGLLFSTFQKTKNHD